MYIYFIIIGIALVVLILLMVRGQSKADQFRNAYEQINVGDTKEKVLKLLGEPTTVLNVDSDTTIYTWETSEWKGAIRGGTKSRVIQVSIKEEKVLSKSGKNLDMSGV